MCIIRPTLCSQSLEHFATWSIALLQFFFFESATVFPYSIEQKFSRPVLDQLEATGTPVMSSLKMLTNELGEVLGFDESDHMRTCPLMIYIWDKGPWGDWGTTRPKTWREFYKVLRELGLEELSQEIQERLTCKNWAWLMP